MKNAPLFPAPGNHDLYSGSGSSRRDAPYFSIFDMPTNGECGGVASNDEGYYSWDYGNIHFLSLESYASPSISDTLGTQAAWVKQDLANNTKEWVGAYWHHPPYTMTSHNSDTEGDLVAIREKFIKWIEKLGVDLVICGHSHGYERSKLMKGNYGKENTFNASVHNTSSSSGLYDGSTDSCPYFKDAAHPKGGTVYVVAGSSGKVGGTAASYPHAAMHTSNNTEGGSLVLEFDGNRLDAKWLKANGSIGDKFTIIKNSNKRVQQTINSGESVNLSASWNGGSYVWSNGATEKSVTVNPTSNSTYIVRDQYSCVADTFNLVVQSTTNLGFENNFTSWYTYGTASINTANVKSGTKSGYFSGVGGNSGGNYVVTGLTPGATYKVKAWVKAVTGQDSWVVVNNYGGAQTGKQMTSTSWTQSGDIIFTMGANNTSATLAAWTGNGSAAYFDDFTIAACPNCRTASAEAESQLQLEDFTLQLHPNPATREVTINLTGFEGESAVQVKMMDMAGKPFLRQQVQPSGREVTLSIGHLPQGLFFVTVYGSKTTKTAKLFITK